MPKPKPKKPRPIDMLLQHFGGFWQMSGPDEWTYVMLEETKSATLPRKVVGVRAKYREGGVDGRIKWVNKVFTRKDDYLAAVRRAEQLDAELVETWVGEITWSLQE